MRKLRVFIAEIVGVALLLGWLMWKYPESVEPIVPWVALVVLLHITWEFIIEPLRGLLINGSGRGIEMLKQPTRSMPWEVKWIFIAIFWIGLSMFYFGIIQNALHVLAKYHAVPSVPSPSAPPPAPTSAQTPITKEESDLQGIFYGKQELFIQYKNITNVKAETPRIGYALLDLSNPYKYSVHPGDQPTAQPFPIPTEVLKDTWINPGESGGYTSVLQNFRDHIKLGDVVFGVVSIDCQTCKKRHSYYVYWRSGDGGWYSEGNPKDMKLMAPVAQPLPDNLIQQDVDRIVPKSKRTNMSELFSN